MEKDLQFSTHRDTVRNVSVLGIGLVPLLVPLHNCHLLSDLVCWEVTMGIRPHLPIQGIDIILGNDLAGAKVWKDGPLLLGANSPLQDSQDSESPEVCLEKHPEVVFSCAFMQAMIKAKAEQSEASEKTQFSPKRRKGIRYNSFPSRCRSLIEDCIEEQASDPHYYCLN